MDNTNIHIGLDRDGERSVKDGLAGYSREAVELAREVLHQTRISLMMSFRFLDTALWRMPLRPAPIACTLATDGLTLWYDPLFTLRAFRSGKNELARDMLHSLLHCILRNPFDGSHEDTHAWWLACDIAVEEMAREMAGGIFPSMRDRKQVATMAGLHRIEGALTPQRLYETLHEQIEGLDAKGTDAAKRFGEVKTLFLRDSHQFWQRDGETGEHARTSKAEDPPRHAETSTIGEPQGADEESEPGSKADASGPQSPDSPENRSESPDDVRSEKRPSEHPDETALEEAHRAWKDISKRIQEDLETYSSAIGSAAGNLMANIALTNRKELDYTEFLRKFATRREDMRINDDEFDYVFYTYGLDTYGDMPLIEPLEYQETDRVREFVIALDTSESCAGDLIKGFIDHTFHILQQSQHWGSRVNLHIIQCDAAIREDLKITSLSELGRLSGSFRVKGFGGTDFRPVFNHVDKMIHEGEFSDLRGLIYFTDGYGTFPKTPPAYDAAFVFIEDDGQARDVPPWAMKVVLRSDQLSALTEQEDQ